MQPIDWMNIEACAFARADAACDAGDQPRQLREAKSAWMAWFRAKAVAANQQED